MALIQFSDFAPYKDISPNIDSASRIEPYINNAQLLDIKPLLGSVFYADIVANPTTTDNAFLLNGGTYTWGNYTYTFAGLKAVLVYFAYARFIQNQQINVTRFGVVYKNNSDVSERVERSAITGLANEAKEIAKAYFEECELYLSRNPQLFPLWRVSGTDNTYNHSGIIISAVGGNSNKKCVNCKRVNCNCYAV